MPERASSFTDIDSRRAGVVLRESENCRKTRRIPNGHIAGGYKKKEAEK
jgi:hypothetical protein